MVFRPFVMEEGAEVLLTNLCFETEEVWRRGRPSQDFLKQQRIRKRNPLEREREGSRKKAEQNKEGEGNHHARGERHLLLSSGLPSTTSTPKWGIKLDEIWYLGDGGFVNLQKKAREKGRMVQKSKKFADILNGILLAG